MTKNSDNFSMREAMALANSEAGQRIITLLKTQNNPKLQKAAREAAAGNYGEAKQSLSAALSPEQIQAILEQLRRPSNG